jgi:hypothetical protein
LNRSEKTIEQNTLDEIESQGVTCERLESLGVPVFYYKTQITIHGLFPELINQYLTGYKSIFQNQNKSIGVKYIAVDYLKKELVYKTVTDFLPGWHVIKNSTDFEIVTFSQHFNDKEQYKLELANMQTKVEHVDKSLFSGSVGVYLARDTFSYFLVAYISIGSIYKNNVEKLIESICKKPLAEINEAIKLKKEQQQAADNALKLQWDQEREQKAIKTQQYINETTPLLIAAGYVEHKEIKIYDGLTGLTFNDDGKLAYRKYIKPKGKKLFHKAGQVIRNLSEIESINIPEYNYHKTHVDKVTNFWIKSEHTAGLKPQISINEKLNGIELRFQNKPNQSILDQLKSAGWRWSNFNQCWYNRNTPANMDFANQII